MSKNKHCKKLKFKCKGACGSATLTSNFFVSPLTSTAVTTSQFAFPIGTVPTTFNGSTTLIPIAGINTGVARFNNQGDTLPHGTVCIVNNCSSTGFSSIFIKAPGTVLVSATLNIAAFAGTTPITSGLIAQVVFIPFFKPKSNCNNNFNTNCNGFINNFNNTNFPTQTCSYGEVIVASFAIDDTNIAVLTPVTFNAPTAGRFEIRIALATNLPPITGITAILLGNSEFTVTQLTAFKKH